jgi:ketosteroid isomerase-like protein
MNAIHLYPQDPATVSDRALLRDLVEAYAVAVDRREFPAAAELFTDDAILVLPDVPASLEPCVEHRGRAAIHQSLLAVESCLATLHAIGAQCFDVRGDEASGIVSCLAHHVIGKPDDPKDLVWAARYDDTYIRHSDGWRFSLRKVSVDWIEVRPVRYIRGRSI